jgi:hypothetical protein
MNRADVIDVAASYPIDEIIKRYAKDQEVSVAVAEEHAREVKRYLTLCAIYPDRIYGMRGPIDEFWHTFVIFTARYADFCERVAGRFVHHFPNTEPKERIRYSFNRGRKGGPQKEASRSDLKQLYLDMLRDYEEVFGEPPPKHLWPLPSDSESEGGAAGCVGCYPCRCGCRCIA